MAEGARIIILKTGKELNRLDIDALKELVKFGEEEGKKNDEIIENIAKYLGHRIEAIYRTEAVESATAPRSRDNKVIFREWVERDKTHRLVGVLDPENKGIARVMHITEERDVDGRLFWSRQSDTRCSISKNGGASAVELLDDWIFGFITGIYK